VDQQTRCTWARTSLSIAYHDREWGVPVHDDNVLFALSRDLLARGFTFVGSTICYAFMQAVGMVNDHTTDCFRYEAVGQAAPGPLSSTRGEPSVSDEKTRRRRRDANTV
jgi:3-methyladenine DNA glycosylase Tag